MHICKITALLHFLFLYRYISTNQINSCSLGLRSVVVVITRSYHAFRRLLWVKPQDLMVFFRKRLRNTSGNENQKFIYQ